MNSQEWQEVKRIFSEAVELSAAESDAFLKNHSSADAEILAEVWKLDPQRTVTRTIDMHISVLRKKLGDLAKTPEVLLTVHGVGYMLRIVNG